MVVSKRPLSGAYPEIRNEGAVWGFWGRRSQPTEANRDLGAKPPAAGGTGAEPQTLENFAFFCKNNLILGL